MLTRKTSLICCVTLVLAGCYHSDQATLYPGVAAQPGTTQCDTTNVSYSKQISPILMQNCAKPGCHASSAPTGGYTLDNYIGVRSIVLSGRIVGAITHSAGYPSMPKDAAMLNACQIGLIKSWIDQGYHNN